MDYHTRLSLIRQLALARNMVYVVGSLTAFANRFDVEEEMGLAKVNRNAPIETGHLTSDDSSDEPMRSQLEGVA